MPSALQASFYLSIKISCGRYYYYCPLQIRKLRAPSGFWIKYFKQLQFHRTVLALISPFAQWDERLHKMHS